MLYPTKNKKVKRKYYYEEKNIESIRLQKKCKNAKNKKIKSKQ